MPSATGIAPVSAGFPAFAALPRQITVSAMSKYAASRRRFWGLIVSGLLLAGLAGCSDQVVKEVRPGPPLGTAPVLDAAAARDKINAYRAAKGLAPLAIDPKLMQAATVQAEDLAKRDTLDHRDSSGSMPIDRIKAAGYDPQLAAENIAAGQIDFDEVLEGWEKSRRHNRNLLLPDASEMGIAVAFDGKTHFRSFWALVLARPAPPQTSADSPCPAPSRKGAAAMATAKPSCSD